MFSYSSLPTNFFNQTQLETCPMILKLCLKSTTLVQCVWKLLSLDCGAFYNKKLCFKNIILV